MFQSYPTIGDYNGDFDTLAEAEAWLQSEGFRPTGIADWINDAGDDAGVYSIDGIWRVEITHVHR